MESGDNVSTVTTNKMTDLQTTPFSSLHTSLYKDQKDSQHTIDFLYKNKNMKNDSKINKTDDDKQESVLYSNERVYINLHDDCKKSVLNNSSNTEVKHITDKPYTEQKNQVKILSSGTKLETTYMNPKEIINNSLILDHECEINKDKYVNMSNNIKMGDIENITEKNNYPNTYSEDNPDIIREHEKEESESNNNTNTKQILSEDNMSDTGVQEPAHHARRPMNAFLIFCKRHRGVVRARYPSLENRAVTKILGEWWAGLDQEEKASYTALAKQYKDAFFSANPDFKWYKLPAPPLRTLSTRPSNSTVRTSPLPSSTCSSPETPPTSTSTGSSIFTPGKLADETQLGNLNSLINPNYHVPANDIINESVSKNNIPTTINNNDYSLLEFNNRFKNHDSTSLFYRSETIGSSPIPEKVFLQTPPGSIESNTAPKPPKKRFVNDIKKLEIGKNSVSRSIFTMSANDYNDEKELQYSPHNVDKSFSNEQNPFFNLRNYAYSSTQSIEDNRLKRVSKITNLRISKEKMENSLCCTSENDTNKSTNSIDDILNYDSKNIGENMTQQELIDRVVDRSMCSDLESHSVSLQLSSDSEINVIEQKCDSIERRMMHTNKMDVRKSVRSCKGKRYAEFMIEGRLIVNKRIRKNNMPTIHLTGSKKIKHKDKQDDSSEHASNNESNISFIGLSDTIQKLTDRTKNYSSDIFESDAGSSNGEINFATEPRKRTLSEASDDSITKKMFRAEDFDLNAKIEALPSLSLDKFQQKKKENKKKKKIVHTSKHTLEPTITLRKEPNLRQMDIISTRDNNGDINEEANNNVEVLIGSRKRKARKQSITHIDPQMIATVKTSVAQPELFNLATLAEVALKMKDKFTAP